MIHIAAFFFGLVYYAMDNLTYLYKVNFMENSIGLKRINLYFPGLFTKHSKLGLEERR